MSHAATHWLADLPPGTMTHGEFRVLFHLCDCHNASMGCFPKQTYLREHTGLSNGGLNKALAGLEEKGLILRKQERDARTNRQKPTHYILGFEIDGQQEPSPLSGAGKSAKAVSTFDAVPSPLSEGVRLHSGGVYIDEPVKEPVKEPCAPTDAAHTQDLIFEDFVAQFERAYPRLGDGTATVAALKAAIEDGADPAAILAGARAYAAEQKNNRKQYIAYSENWLRDKRWTQHTPTKSAIVDRERLLETHAKTIKEGKAHLCSPISDAMAWECVQAELVTMQDCRAVGKLL
ncbi:helix-turn-helix domain-containing protein [uncultured Ruegeria sp.]|uniref:helix-turn-helix domain-containing protein n=1 Tax=uncultured Ruegeria sp. TaxID=259304 RepID=UPI00261C4E38|nr:helix-turn-helix domain-containing protein [uncultured Ruegeria sp.]